jgi:hypothetical protein
LHLKLTRTKLREGSIYISLNFEGKYFVHIVKEGAQNMR